jgi:hypothetical protein
MKLMTKAIEKRIPALSATDEIPFEEKICHVKLFDPTGSWTWYAVEYDPKEQLFWGLIHGFEKEWGYFSLIELQSVKGRLGLGIERDLHFKPTKMKELPGYE